MHTNDCTLRPISNTPLFTLRSSVLGSHPNVVSPSKRRIQPSAISFGVSVFGLAFCAWQGNPNASSKKVVRIFRIEETPKLQPASQERERLECALRSRGVLRSLTLPARRCKDLYRATRATGSARATSERAIQ